VHASTGADRDLHFPSGSLGHKGRSATRFLVPPFLTILRRLIFSEKLCRETRPRIRSSNRSPVLYPCERCTKLSVADLPAARRGLFSRGQCGFNNRALGEDSPRLCRQTCRLGCGQWPRQLVSGWIETPELDESRSLPARFPSVFR
jgi:hypothetical protein